MRGINKVVISGNVAATAHFNELRGGLVCSFPIISDRYTRGDIISAFVRINVYIDNLARICRDKVVKGGYVIVEGELMNRDGVHEELTEVRAREIVFVS